MYKCSESVEKIRRFEPFYACYSILPIAWNNPRLHASVRRVSMYSIFRKSPSTFGAGCAIIRRNSTLLFEFSFTYRGEYLLFPINLGHKLLVIIHHVELKTLSLQTEAEIIFSVSDLVRLMRGRTMKCCVQAFLRTELIAIFGNL